MRHRQSVPAGPPPAQVRFNRQSKKSVATDILKMSLSVLRNYAVLPLQMAGSIFLNCAMTIFNKIAPEKMFQSFLKETGLEQDQKYLDSVQNSAWDVAFFWPRLKAFWFRWVFGNWIKDGVTLVGICGLWVCGRKVANSRENWSIVINYVSFLETIWILLYISNICYWNLHTMLSY